MTISVTPSARFPIPGMAPTVLFKAAFTAVALFIIVIAVVAYTTGKGL